MFPQPLEREPSLTRARGYLWCAAAAVAALVPFLGGFSGTHVFFVRDLGLYFWPRHVWLLESWRARDWPLWDPYAGGGQSAIADALNHFVLLPVTVIRLLAPPVAGFNFWVAAPFPLLAVGAWIWLRRRHSPAAAAVGAGLMALAGPILSTGNFPNLSWTVACIPWVLWAVDRLCERRSMARFAGLAAVVGFQGVAGEPVTYAATAAVAIAYAAFAWPARAWRARAVRTLRICAPLSTGLLLAAIQLAPLLYAASGSRRGGAEYDATFWSLHPLALLETVVPHLFGHVYHAYIETLPWVQPLNTGREPLFYSLYTGMGAVVLAMVRAEDTAVRAWRRFWWIVLAGSLVCALGENTFVYPAAQQAVPLLNSFRFPVKYLVFTATALCALAAGGADAILSHSRAAGAMRTPVPILIALAVAAALAVIAGLGSLIEMSAVVTLWQTIAAGVGADDPAEAAAWLTGGWALWLRLAAFALVVALLLTLVWRRHATAAVCAWAICALAVVDVGIVNADLHPTIEASRLGPPEWVAATSPSARVYVGGRIGVEPGARVRESELVDSPKRFHPPVDVTPQEAIVIYSTRFVPTPAAWRVRELVSYDLPQLWPREYILMLTRFREASAEDRLRFLRRTGHRYCYVDTPPTPDAELLGAAPIAHPMALYACGDDARRAYVTTEARVEPDIAQQIAALFDPRHDPEGVVLLDRGVAPPGHAASGSEAAAEIIRERNTELVLRVSVPAGGGYLTVLDSYDPFWSVDVNGRAGTLVRANGLFRAVPLPAGTHDVRFVYRPVPFYAGALVTATVALLLVAACAIARTRAARRAAAVRQRAPVR